MATVPYPASWEGWAQFVGGAAVGASVELSTNVEDKCIAGIAGILESSYLIYYYMRKYFLTESEENIAYAVTYVTKAFREGF